MQNYIHVQQTTDLKIFYTDGSKQNDGDTGFAVYCPEENVKICRKLPNNTSIFTAEVFAIRSALLYIKNNNLKNVLMCTDSKSSIQSLKRSPEKVSESWYIINLIVIYDIRA